jgi:hypothetical protein
MSEANANPAGSGGGSHGFDMKSILIILLVAALLGIGAGFLLRAHPSSSPKPGQGSSGGSRLNGDARGGGGSTTASGGGSSMTVEQVGDALEQYGKNTINDNGNVRYTLTAQKVEVTVSLSPNGHVIWITTNMSQAPSANQASAGALLEMLKKNNDIGPMFFSIDGNSFRLSYPVPNYGQTASSIKERVDALVGTASDSQSLVDSASGRN